MDSLPSSCPSLPDIRNVIGVCWTYRMTHTQKLLRRVPANGHWRGLMKVSTLADIDLALICMCLVAFSASPTLSRRFDRLTPMTSKSTTMHGCEQASVAGPRREAATLHLGDRQKSPLAVSRGLSRAGDHNVQWTNSGQWASGTQLSPCPFPLR